MRLVIIIGIILVLAWLGYELRGRSKEISTACYGVSFLFLVLLVAVWVYG